ncbi:MAG TPA: glycosyltransferase family 1 protein [Gemmatimonadales bacterium]|nr:glycosyltransferase family 1 protein [Gemmatimonadales bacterium]
MNGVTTVVRRIAALLTARGHAAALVAPRYPSGGSPGDERELRVASVAFPLYPDIRLSLPSFRTVATFLDRFQPELLHVHTEGALGAAGRRYALRHGVPLVTSFHTNFPQYSRHYGVGLLEPAVWRWLEWFHRPARLTLTPGEAVRDDLWRRGIGQAVVWGRGVDTTFFHPARRHASWRRWLAGSDDAVIVLHVGRLAREKNLGVLINTWRLARAALGPRATFVVAGEGPLTRRIAAELPFVRQLGFLPREDLATLYASADLCVFPSHTETCGLVALEAMASGVPVIAADAGGFRESVRSGVTGFLVPPRDPPAYVAAITELVADAGRRFACAAAAREHALSRDAGQEDAALLDYYAGVAIPREGRVAPCAA